MAQGRLDTSEFMKLIKLNGVSIRSYKVGVEDIEVFYNKKSMGKVCLSFE